MIHLTNDLLFRGQRGPLMVHEMVHIGQTQQVLTDCVKVVFVTAGWSDLTFAEGTTQLGPGSVVTIPAKTWCSATPRSFTHTVTFYLHEEFIQTQLQWLSSQHPLAHHLVVAQSGGQAPTMLNVGLCGIQALRPALSALSALDRRVSSELTRLARVADVLTAVALFAGNTSQHRMAKTAQQPPAPHRQVAEATRVLHQHLGRAWTIANLASEVALSESQLTRLFRQDLGISPAAFLWNARADRMAELLSSSDVTITEAARSVGWQNASAASRAFKRRYGLTPSAFTTRTRGPQELVERSLLR